MGCSVGGQVALDLARYHPTAFRGVISLGPALKLEADDAAPPGCGTPR